VILYYHIVTLTQEHKEQSHCTCEVVILILGKTNYAKHGQNCSRVSETGVRKLRLRPESSRPSQRPGPMFWGRSQNFGLEATPLGKSPFCGLLDMQQMQIIVH